MEKLVIDLHSHTFFSDGELCPAELAQRARMKGYGILAITDHADYSNYNKILEQLFQAKESLNHYENFKVLLGLELTHVPPKLIDKLVHKARNAGAQIIVVHGETIVEPVERYTNESAVDASVDVLAHPGLITEKCAKKAATNKVLLEISSRRGSSITNGHVARIAREQGALLAFNTDAHAPGDLHSGFEMMQKLALGSGITAIEFEAYYQHLLEKTAKIF
jgi:histidinol phosphatase-like PHP family hydrolase